jgi:hypothetical protein
LILLAPQVLLVVKRRVRVNLRGARRAARGARRAARGRGAGAGAVRGEVGPCWSSAR